MEGARQGFIAEDGSTITAKFVGTLDLATGKATASWQFFRGTGKFAKLTGGSADMVAENDLATGAFKFNFSNASLSFA